MRSYFRIANINICIESEFEILWNKYIKEFEVNECVFDEFYHIVVSDEFITEGNVVYQDDSHIVFMNDGYEQRLHFYYGTNIPCMLYKESKEGKFVYVNKHYLYLFMEEDNYTIFNALAFEKVLMEHNAFVLHCSFIEYNGKAILFSAPSGTGKSTQASLWQKYECATIVNGDRAIVLKVNDKYYAYGMPICGSSDICLNKEVEILCVVYLYQNSVNSIRLLDKKTTMKNIMSETTISFFNPVFVSKIMDLCQDFALNTDMYLFGCTKYQDAVQCLKEVLYESD